MRGMLAASAGPLCVFVSSCQVGPPLLQAPPQSYAVARISVVGTWEVFSIDGIVVRPKSVNVTFRSDGAFAAILDCNNARGFYELSGARLSFHGWYSTERGCDPPLQHLDLITKALQGDGYVVNLTSSSQLNLTGPHQLILRRS
jgi:heat shock protein HslJ